MQYTTNLNLGKPEATDLLNPNSRSAFNTNADTIDGAIGDLDDLDTTVKTSLVDAINEVSSSAGGVKIVRFTGTVASSIFVYTGSVSVTTTATFSDILSAVENGYDIIFDITLPNSYNCPNFTRFRFNGYNTLDKDYLEFYYVNEDWDTISFLGVNYDSTVTIRSSKFAHNSST